MTWAAFFDAAPDGLLLVDSTGEIVHANESAHTMLHWPSGSLLGKDLATVIPEAHHATHAAHLEAWFASPQRRSMSLRRRLLARRADGETFPVEISLSPVRAGNEVLAIAAMRDVSETERLRSDLAARERLAGLGLLAASLAHELNNPLSFILANLDLAREELGDHPVQAMLADARVGCERVSTIVTDLLALGKDPAHERDVATPVGPTLDAAVRMAGPRLRRNAQLDLRVAEGLVSRGGAARLLQVVVNLLANAARAVAPLGREQGRITLSAALAPDGFVEIDVGDNGPGIAPALRPHLFHAFSTTASADGGNGLGLYYSRRLAEEVGGTLDEIGAPGGGAHFRLRLPAG